MENKHSARAYEIELMESRNSVQQMVFLVHNLGTKCLDALLNGKLGKAYKNILRDDEIDQLEMNIESQCLHIIVRRQPLAGDLRFVLSVQKTINNLENIADLFVEISEKTIELLQNEKYVIDEPSIKPMFIKVLENLNQSVEAFLSSDHEKASYLILQDRHIDAYYSQIFRSLMEKMRMDQDNFAEIYRLMTIISAIEKIGDHTKHICSSTYFYSTGKQISHQYKHLLHQKKLPDCILFLCAENSARSQIAEGLAKALLPIQIEIFSAGTSPTLAVHPMAIEVMQEIDIDISENRPKRLTDIPLGKVDQVIILCSDEVCINLPKQVIRQSWLLEDPAAHEDEATKRQAFRAVRDELKEKLTELRKSFDELLNNSQ